MILANVSTKLDYTCGGTGVVFSGTFPSIISTIILLIQIVIPILLIIFGMLDLGKAVVASKEDEIKKGQQLFIKRVITAIIVFFVILIVKTVINFVSGNDQNIMGCFNCFIRGTAGDNSCVLSE